MTEQIRIGNCSGFYGDRFAAMREMLDGGELDVLTGDYLAELTMLILARDRLKDPEAGYAKTFLRQMEECLGLAMDRGVRRSLAPRSPMTPKSPIIDVLIARDGDAWRLYSAPYSWRDAVQPSRGRTRRQPALRYAS